MRRGFERRRRRRRVDGARLFDDVILVVVLVDDSERRRRRRLVVFPDAQQARPRQFRVHLEPSGRGRGGGGGGRHDDEVDAVSGHVVVSALQEPVRVQAGVLSARALARVLAQRGAEALARRGRDRLGDRVRRADDGVAAHLDALQPRRLVPVDPDEQRTTTLPRDERDPVRRPQLRRAARLQRAQAARADAQLRVDAAAGHRAARHRVGHHAGLRQPLDVAGPQSVDRPVDAAAAATAAYVHGRRVAEVADAVRRLLVRDLDALPRPEQIHRARRAARRRQRRRTVGETTSTKIDVRTHPLSRLEDSHAVLALITVAVEPRLLH